jgi:signal peptidase II
MTINKAQLKKAAPWFGLSLLIILLDQLAKYFMVHGLESGQSLRIFPFFNLILSYNQGAAFGFLGEQSGWQIFFLSMISLIVIVILSIWLLRLSYPSPWTACALSLVIGGAAGNLIDRLRLAYVIDFFDFHLGSWHYATFNTADSAIVIGIFILLLRNFLTRN